MDNTYEWCNDGVEAEINNLKNLPIERLRLTFLAVYLRFGWMRGKSIKLS